MAGEAFDADVVLGVAAKATQVFAQDADAFFSYPLAPIGFRQNELREMAAGKTAEGLKALAEFSYLVNAIPSGPVWSPLPEGFLWDVYGDVIGHAELAEATRTKAEKKAYDKAYGYLHQVAADGTPTDSEAVLQFRKYRDAWLVLAEQYKNAAAEAEGSSDAAVVKQWKEAVEPVLREKQVEVEGQWKTDGHRAEVEEARRVVEGYGQNSPAEAWAGYRRLFDPSAPAVYYATDIGGGKYVPSSFRPSSAIDGAWGKISLSREELQALATTAPAALRDRLGQSVDSGVESLSFEYTSVAISRGWFSPDVFASHAWRFPAGTKPLSDGDSESPKGRCPGYVTGLVLLRNLRIVHDPAKLFKVFETLTGSPGGGTVEGSAAAQAPSLGALFAGSPSEVEPLRMESLTTLAADGPPAAADASTATVEPLRPELLAMLASDDFERVGVELPATAGQVEAPPPAEDAQVEVAPPEELYVLGFVCKRLPKSPDPAPGLRWPDDSGPPWPGRELKQPPTMKGPDVRQWEKQMKARGWKIGVDGDYDASDEAICRQFQAEKGLEVDGEVGPVTWRAAWNVEIT
jgi:hypothetical protein